MKTAKQWANEFDATSNPSELNVVLEQFIDEVDAIAKARGGSSAAYESSLAEQCNKFRAVCRRTTRVTFQLWDAALRLYGKDYVKKAQAYEKTVAARKGDFSNPPALKPQRQEKRTALPTGGPGRKLAAKLA